MRILHTSDWHIGKFVNEYSMLDDQKDYFDKLISLIKTENIDAVIVAGDVFHRSVPSAECVTLASEIFYKIAVELKVPLLIIAGNHDSRERLSYMCEFARHSGVYIESFIKKDVEKVTLTDKFGDVNFYLMPYIEPAIVRNIFPDEQIKTFDDAVEVVSKSMLDNLDTSKRNILIGHGFFSFFDMSEIEAEEKCVLSQSEVNVGGSDLVNAKRFTPFDYVALGHLHAVQPIGSPNMRYSGSSLKYSVSEANQRKSVTIIELNQKGEIDISTREIAPLHDLRVIDASFDELCDSSIDFGNRNDYIFVNLTDSDIVVDAVNRLKVYFPNLLGIKYINRVLPVNLKTHDVAKLKQTSLQDMFSVFFSDVTGKELTDTEKEIIDEIAHNVQN